MKGSTIAHDKTLSQFLVTTSPTFDTTNRTITLPAGITWNDVRGFSYYGLTPYRGMTFVRDLMELTVIDPNTSTSIKVNGNSNSVTFPSYLGFDEPTVLTFYAIKS